MRYAIKILIISLLLLIVDNMRLNTPALLNLVAVFFCLLSHIKCDAQKAAAHPRLQGALREKKR